jgi:hypothetical protein
MPIVQLQTATCFLQIKFCCDLAILIYLQIAHSCFHSKWAVLSSCNKTLGSSTEKVY